MKKVSLLVAALITVLVLSGCGASVKNRGRKTENMNPETVYRIGISSYLRTRVDFQKYEKMIDDIGGCRRVDPDKMRQEQMRDRTGTQYFFIRNDIHLEKLSATEIEVLKSAEIDENGGLSENAMEVIEKTFPSVIAAKEEDINSDGTVIYDQHIYGSTEMLSVPADALVINIAVQTDRDSREETEEKLYEISRQMEEELSGRLENNVPICIRMDFVATD